MPSIWCCCFAFVMSLAGESCLAQTAVPEPTAAAGPAQPESHIPPLPARFPAAAPPQSAWERQSAQEPQPATVSRPPVVPRFAAIDKLLRLQAVVPDYTFPVCEQAKKAKACPFCPATCPRITASGNERTLLVFTAKWCAPCQAMQPIVEKLVAKGLAVKQLDVDKHADIARRFALRAIPTFVLIEKGKEIDRVVGQTSPRKLMQLIAKSTPAGAGPAHRVLPAAAKQVPADMVQIACDKVEFTIGGNTKSLTFHCSGGVRIKSAEFEAHAEKMTYSNGKLALEGKVAVSVNRKQAPFPRRAVTPISHQRNSGIRYRSLKYEPAPDQPADE